MYDIMSYMITTRLNPKLEEEFSTYAKSVGLTKSEIVRTLIEERLEQVKASQSPWSLGEASFGQYGSGRQMDSTDRKEILKQKREAKLARRH